MGKRLIISGFLILSAFILRGQQKVELPEIEINEDRVKKAPSYAGSTERTVDVLHMTLEIKPDWTRREVAGKADIYFKPYFNPIDSIHLDAKSFVVNQVAMVIGGVHQNVNYRYDGLMLHVALDRQYNKEETAHIFIDYTAQPDSLKGFGSRAIRKGKGFYFIDSTETYDKHFWTQGEPESNSAWFPMVDKPSEKITHEIGITVDSTWQTLSNGELEFRTQNGDGTRTDYWKMDQPHAPYLVMAAAGHFDTVGTRWNNLPVRYFVDPKWKPMAAEIFKSTTEMMTFYSELLGVPFPWQKYDQIVVHQYVSGAMENTTAVVHGAHIYRTKKELADADGEYIIAHELFHQWFGDLVTCKTWSYLPLNEGFASLGEYLWFEHKDGEDAFNWYLNKEFNSYLREFNRGKIEKIIRFDYSKPGDLLDDHTYAKTGLILQMLRTHLGDEAFFESLKKYLTDNAYGTVELDDLRSAFEEVSGQDLRWFFDQWFMHPGHPKIKVTHEYNSDKGIAIVNIEQIQDLQISPVYKLPVDILVHSQLGVKTYPVIVNKQKQSFEIPVQSKPYLVKFDAENNLVAEIEVEQTDAFWLHQLGNSKEMLDRYRSVQHLLTTKNMNLRSTIAGIALDDPFWAIKLLGLESVETWDDNGKKKLKETVKGLLTSENTTVRAKAIEVWSTFFEAKDEKLFQENLGYNSYLVNKAAIKALAATDAKKAIAFSKKQLDDENESWVSTCTSVILHYGSVEDLQQTYERVKTKGYTPRLKYYYILATQLDRGGKEGETGVDILLDASTTDENEKLKYYAKKLLEESVNAMEEDAKTASGADSNKLKAMVKYARAKLESSTPGN